MFEIFINNEKYFFEKNITILQACEKIGIFLPRFCYLETLSVAGSCRMCLVEVEKSPKPVASCAMPISNGMVIFTNTPLVKKAQESVIEFLLLNHPLDCPICDQGGECDLQDITLNFGSSDSRSEELRRVVEDKNCGPIIHTIMTRCIHCTRCIRFLSEIAGYDTFGSLGRGEFMEIGTYLNKFIKTELSGNLIDICPVGALTSKPYTFLARNWELNNIETIDLSDSIGANIIVQTCSKQAADEHIVRVMPKKNNEINSMWINDKTRFSYDGNSYNRLTNIFVSNKYLGIAKISKKELEKDLFQRIYFSLYNNINIVGNSGELLSIHEIHAFSNFLKILGSNNFLINNDCYNVNTDLPLFYQNNIKIKSYKKCDLIFFLGFNARTESSGLNISIQQYLYKKKIRGGLIGPYAALTPKIEHLGTSLKTFLKILEGKHHFCKEIIESKNPLIYTGSEIASRFDGKDIQSLLYILCKKYLRKKININFINSNISQTHFCELGLDSNPNSIVYQNVNNFKNNNKIEYQKEFWYFKKYHYFKTYHLHLFEDVNESLYIFGNNLNSIQKTFLNNYFKESVLLSMNTHLVENSFKSEYLIPILSFFEQEDNYINVDGSISKTTKVKLPDKNEEHIYFSNRIFFKNFCTQYNIYFNLYFENQEIIVENPFMNIKKKKNLRKKFSINFLNQKCFYFSIYKIKTTNLKPVVKFFYLTDNIRSNSKYMVQINAANNRGILYHNFPIFSTDNFFKYLNL